MIIKNEYTVKRITDLFGDFQIFHTVQQGGQLLKEICTKVLPSVVKFIKKTYTKLSHSVWQPSSLLGLTTVYKHLKVSFTWFTTNYWLMKKVPKQLQ